MLIRLRMDLAFELTKQAQAEALRDAVVPFFQNAVNTGAPDEICFIEVEDCHHDEVPPQPCEKIARWEVGIGRVI